MQENQETDRGALSGRTAVNAMKDEIGQAAAQAADELRLDLHGFTGITPAAFDQVLGSCRKAEQDAGQAPGPILLTRVPATCRDMHHRIAKYHHLNLEILENGDWKLSPQ